MSDLVVLPALPYNLYMQRNNKDVLLARPLLRTMKTIEYRTVVVAAPALWSDLPFSAEREAQSLDTLKRCQNIFL